jgi:hypothetical protein
MLLHHRGVGRMDGWPGLVTEIQTETLPPGAFHAVADDDPRRKCETRGP